MIQQEDEGYQQQWDFNEKGTMRMNCHGNDFYIEWVELNAGDYNLESLCEKYLGVTQILKDVKVNVTAKDGMICIRRIV